MHTETVVNSMDTPADPTPQPVAWMGLDWGHIEHAFALLVPGKPREDGPLKATSEALHGWLRSLEKRWDGRPVAVGIETSKGAAINVLLQYPWVIIYPINPVTSATYRKAFTPSGASDDIPDAHVLLDLVRNHADKLRVLDPQDPQTVKLTGLVEARRDFVNRRTQVICQLYSLLRAYYPQALELVGDLDGQLALDLLKRWPDMISLKAARPGVIKQFYYAHNLRRPELMEARLKLIKDAVALTTDDARVSVAVLQLRCLLDQMSVFNKHIAEFDRQTQSVFAAHPEAVLFRDLPGAGAAMGPRLCVAFGTVRTLYPEAANLQKHAGVAPVREKSGQKVWTHWRWKAPAFLRQTFIEWAGQTVVYSEWARNYYKHHRAKGKTRHVILRALAFKWIRILWTCWQTRTPYDEARYLKQLAHRKSPYAVSA